MCELVKIHTNLNEEGRVADIKKDYVLNIIKNAEKCAVIDRVVLFGSVLEERCTQQSDIDMAIFGQKTRYQVLRSKEYLDFTASIYQFGDFQDYDILYFQSNRLNKNIILKDISDGLIIYQKEI